MNFKLLLCLALVFNGGLVASEAQTNSAPQSPTKIWEYINYLWTGAPQFVITSGERWGQVSRGLRLDILNIQQGFQFFKTNTITARLYRANREIVEPTPEGKKLLNAPSGSDSTFSIPGEEPAPQVMTYFPWGTNALEEAWIEVTIGPERYWLEIPYGFDRNPAAPFSPAIAAGPPEWIPAMKPLTEHDHVIHWQSVQYDLGEIGNGWRLSLIQSNTREPESKIALYPIPGQMAKPLQGPDSPRVAVRVVNGDGTVLTGRRVNDHPDGSGRYTFRFGRCGGDMRCWGQIEISAWNETYSVVVPSCLYKYHHGHVPQLIHKINSQ